MYPRPGRPLALLITFTRTFINTHVHVVCMQQEELDSMKLNKSEGAVASGKLGLALLWARYMYIVLQLWLTRRPLTPLRMTSQSLKAHDSPHTACLTSTSLVPRPPNPSPLAHLLALPSMRRHIRQVRIRQRLVLALFATLHAITHRQSITPTPPCTCARPQIMWLGYM